MSLLLHLHPLYTRAAFSYWQHEILKTTFQIFDFRTFVGSPKSIESFIGPILDPSEFVQDGYDTIRLLGLPENNNPMGLAVRSRDKLKRDGNFDIVGE